MKLKEFYDYVDANSDPGAPLTFLTAEHFDGVPRYEEAPYHVLPGERFKFEIATREIIKPYFEAILKHDNDHGMEITKETLLYDFLKQHLERHRKKFYIMTIYDENNEYRLQMLALQGLWTKIESPERNVFHCYGNWWNYADFEMLTGTDSCAVSLAY